MILFNKNKNKDRGKIANKATAKSGVVVKELSDDDLVNIAGGVVYTPEETEQIKEAIASMKSLKMPSA